VSNLNGQARRSSNGSAARRYGDPALSRLGEDALLDMRIRDLPIAIKQTPLESRIERLYGELKAKGIRFRPHFWLSDDWYTPDGVPGVAIPFYLAHPRLLRLERKQMLEVEGGTEEWCMRILRHEAGHALDNAYRLRRRKKWREVFGRATQPYPQYYNPRPFSRSYVVHLDMWYAQSHPVEDFAETFAVWLKPRSRWKSQYKGWPALRKLEVVDELMQEIGPAKPKVVTRVKTDTVKTIRKTLRDHYQYKRDYYGLEHPNFYDRELCRLFSADERYRCNPTAASFLRRIRPMLRRSVARWTGEYQYTIDQVLKEMIDRCRDLRLRLTSAEQEAERDALIVVTVQIMNYLHGGYHRVAL
jgi:hypothetical protein